MRSLAAGVAVMAMSAIDVGPIPHVGEGQKRAREREAPPEPVGEPEHETRQMRRARERRELKSRPKVAGTAQATGPVSEVPQPTDASNASGRK